MCAMPLEKVLRIRFDEVVVDLLQDPSGCWWLLQVKAFTLASKRPASAATVSSLSSSLSAKILSRTQSAPIRFEIGIVPTPQWKKWRCAGRYCATKNNAPESNQLIDDDVEDNKEPCGYLTKKMLRSCEFYDDFVQQQDISLAGGFTEFRSALTFHLQHRLPKRDRSQLYEPQPLCSVCIKRYHSLRQQWIGSVEASNTTIATNSTAGHHRKITLAKLNSTVTEQALLPPRNLPSLHHVPGFPLNGSYSTPALPTSNIGSCSSEQKDSVKPINYLDELAAMEEMLKEHEPSILTKTEIKFQSTAQCQTTSILPSPLFNTLSTKLSDSEDIFPKWRGVTRIEEMWQNLNFKPLETQLTNPQNDSGDMKQGYNSISLQQELTKLNCRRVFEDENYREELVNDVLSSFRSGNSNVCFAVNPHNYNPKNTHDSSEDENELAEMALHSLYIDVKLAITGSSNTLSSSLSPSSWPMRPTLCRETSGCITVKLGPV
ncbi:hypothetical protein PHMEG_000322 [Phytophthora megakarya]|uniref:Uncharacterized protein n=1 Tax=Phytophthora megakarya TaxID=4795 RepID=A0A225X5N1_9STRA|nr:hypothetical protein PHMEG_000322 [Phytophthora megakarya]